MGSQKSGKIAPIALVRMVSAGIVVLLAACMGTDESASNATASGAISPSEQSSGQSVATNSIPVGPNQTQLSTVRTTLGTRATPARTDQTVVTNESGRFTDYQLTEDFPQTVTLPKGFIRMRDGVQLAYTVTLPATADRRAAPGAFPVILVQSS